VFAVELLVRTLDAPGRALLQEHLMKRLDGDWRAVLLPVGARLFAPHGRVCKEREQLHD